MGTVPTSQMMSMPARPFNWTLISDDNSIRVMHRKYIVGWYKCNSPIDREDKRLILVRSCFVCIATRWNYKKREKLTSQYCNGRMFRQFKQYSSFTQSLNAGRVKQSMCLERTYLFAQNLNEWHISDAWNKMRWAKLTKLWFYRLFLKAMLNYF